MLKRYNKQREIQTVFVAQHVLLQYTIESFTRCRRCCVLLLCTSIFIYYSVGCFFLLSMYLNIYYNCFMYKTYLRVSQLHFKNPIVLCMHLKSQSTPVRVEKFSFSFFFWINVNPFVAMTQNHLNIILQVKRENERRMNKT